MLIYYIPFNNDNHFLLILKIKKEEQTDTKNPNSKPPLPPNAPKINKEGVDLQMVNIEMY